MEHYLMHYGVMGQKWGIRRYQNPDGSLTEAGRKRLGISDYSESHNKDIVLKKGTEASRVVDTPFYDEHADPDVGGSPEKAKQYINSVIEKEKGYERKYLSVDNVINSGRHNGQDYYLSWFTDSGWDPNHALVTKYTLLDDVKVASGEKVLNALIEEVGQQKISDMLKNGSNMYSLTLQYTTNMDLFNSVNKRFIDAGYDAVEDINDPDTDLPIILFDSKTNAKMSKKVQTGKEAIDEYFNKRR